MENTYFWRKKSLFCWVEFGFKKYYLSYMTKFESAPKVLTFGMHLLHRLLRPMVTR